MEEEPYNPEYVVVDRVLDESITPDPITGNPVTYYLGEYRHTIIFKIVLYRVCCSEPL